MERVAIYLRKSRADIELEADGIDTLDKHRRTLLTFAKERGLNIVHIYEELASGESLLYRPEMQNLLKDVQNGSYQAVLVMDMDRLGRGNMQEQGLIIDTFRESDTKIITPRKTYDLRDEWDEEYSEFEAFMARKELKIITRRLQSGRLRSVKEGNYITGHAPFGYVARTVSKLQKRLFIVDAEAEIVRMIFNLYASKEMGVAAIAKHLKNTGIKANGKTIYTSRIYNMLKNKTYIGHTEWRKTKWKINHHGGSKHKITKRNEDEIILAKNTHEPIIDEELFQKVQEILKKNTIPPKKNSYPLSNPLSGLLKCANCGSAMVRHASRNREDYIRCDKKCGNRSTKLSKVEEIVVHHIEQFMENHKIKLENNQKKTDNNHLDSIIKHTKKEIGMLLEQKNKLHDLLEQGVYSIETYLERSQILANQITEKENGLTMLKHQLEDEKKKQMTRKNFIPVMINVMKLYHKSKSIEQKNKLLKSIVEKIEYARNHEHLKDSFDITIYPKLPR